VIIGASSLSHIEQNLLDFEKGPLRERFLFRAFMMINEYSRSGRGCEGVRRRLAGCEGGCRPILPLSD
jgi:hypothetical protein